MNDDVTVRIYHAMAVLTCRSTAAYRDKGSDISHRTRVTRLYVKRQGRWQLVAQRATVIRILRAPRSSHGADMVICA